jgi:hypothetical protein
VPRKSRISSNGIRSRVSTTPCSVENKSVYRVLVKVAREASEFDAVYYRGLLEKAGLSTRVFLCR